MKPDFEQLVEDNFSRVFNLLYRLSGDFHAAQDLCQEVFFNAWRHYPQFRGESDAYTWLYRIAINRFYKYYRRNRLRAWLGLDEVAPEEFSYDPEEKIEQDDQHQAVARAVAQLPPDFRTVIVLHYFEDMDCQSIARILKSSVGTVKSRLWRGRQMLAKALNLEHRDRGADDEMP